MRTFRVYLFKRFCVRYQDQVLTELEAQKAQELLCYLLIHHNQPHTREMLASLLWNNGSTSKTKQYLRQTLWQLQSTLECDQLPGHALVSVEGDWIQANPTADVWVDVYEFESAYTLAQGIEGRELDMVKAEALQKAVQLYQGNLLENWYQDWCVFERERLQNIYLAMLDKLIGYCESIQAYEDGIAYGSQLLKCDRAHERTYRRLMRLYYLAGNRTGALRQYLRCEKVLQEELNVKPSQRTNRLYWQIQTEQFADNGALQASNGSPAAQASIEPLDILARLKQLQHTLIQAQHQLDQEIEAVKSILINHS